MLRWPPRRRRALPPRRGAEDAAERHPGRHVMIAASGMIVIIDSQTAGSPPDVPVCATSAFPDATVIVIAVQDPDQALQDCSLGAPFRTTTFSAVSVKKSITPDFIISLEDGTASNR